MPLNVEAQHLARQPICRGGSRKVSILEVSWHVFFLYFYVISNFRVPYNSGHGVALAILRLYSIPLDSTCCERQSAARRAVHLARMRSYARSPQKVNFRPIGRKSSNWTGIVIDQKQITVKVDM